jgi:hypothetical protein
MKKPSNPTNLHQSNQRKKKVGHKSGSASNTNGTNRNNHEHNHSTMTYFKSVFKSLFALITKTTSEAVENDSSRNKVRGVSCKYDQYFTIYLIIMFFFLWSTLYLYLF